MTGMTGELVMAPARTIRRATVIWAAAFALLIAGTVAVWPAFKGSSAISHAMDQLPQGVVRAFGLGGFGTPAGFLRGNLYDLFVPLLLTGVAVYFVNSVTAGEEDTGRLELIFAQPVARRAVFAGRAVAALLGLLLLAVVTALVQFGIDAPMGLSIGADRLGATLVLCALLAVFVAGQEHGTT